MSSYHGWTHAPKSQGGTDPVPMPIPSWFRAYCTSTVTRTSGGSQTTIDWNEWESSNASVFTPLDASLVEADPGETVRRVQLDAAGYYTIFFGAVADLNADGSVELAMHDGDDTWGYSDSVNHYCRTAYGSSFLVLSLSRIYPIFDPFGGTNDVPQVSFTVAQMTGANIDFTPLWMEIHYLPADTAVVAS